METYKDLYKKICSYENLELAFQKARKGKSLKHYVIEFEKDLENNLLKLRTELSLHSYRPKPLKHSLLKIQKQEK